jgi:hypothetical protein
VEVWRSASQDSIANDAGVFLETDMEVWTASGFMGPTIGIFAWDGGSSTRIGGRGDGPSEFSDILGGDAGSDGTALALLEADRLSLVNVASRGFEWRQRIDLPAASAVSMIPGGIVVLARPNTSVSGWTFPLGGGEATAWDYPDQGPWSRRASASAVVPEGDVWILESHETGFRLHLLELGDPASVVRSHSIELSWWYSPALLFDEGSSPEGPVSNAVPTQAIRVRDFGEHLLVLVLHPDNDLDAWDEEYWEPGAVMDTAVLAIDPLTGEVLAVARIDEQAAGFTNRGHLAVYEVDDAGFPSWTLVEARLTR